MKLPGKMKVKKTILLVLVIVAILVLIYEGVKNNKEKINLNKETQDQETQFKEESKEIDINLKNNEDLLKKEEQEKILYNESYTLFFSNEYEKAISKANELIEVFPSNAKGYNIRGIAKSYNGDFEEGMKDIDKALELDPQYGYAMFNKALTYELYGKLDDALVWYNKNLEVEKYVWTYYGIASIYGRRGDIQNTVTYLKKAIDIDESVKKEARDEADFNPVRDYEEFQKLIM
ncbi:tetratricopeptide repeat protein [Clostridium weizhouense]